MRAWVFLKRASMASISASRIFEVLEQPSRQHHGYHLTHEVHEDHPWARCRYILKKFNVPGYASRFTSGLAESKLMSTTFLVSVMPAERASRAMW